MGRPHHILLVPGFFGFANLGDFTYFGHVRNYLAEKGPALGIDGEVRVARTEPTASLPRRAALLCEALATLLDESPGRVTPGGPLERRPGRPAARDPRGGHPHPRRRRALRRRRPFGGHRLDAAPGNAARPVLRRDDRPAVPAAPLAGVDLHAPDRAAAHHRGAQARPGAAESEVAPGGGGRPDLPRAARRLRGGTAARRRAVPGGGPQRPGARLARSRRRGWRSSTPPRRTAPAFATARW